MDANKVLADGQADFDVCTSSVLLDRAKGRNLVVLGVIFQHSAAIVLVPRRAGIAAIVIRKPKVEEADAPAGEAA